MIKPSIRGYLKLINRANKRYENLLIDMYSDRFEVGRAHQLREWLINRMENKYEDNNNKFAFYRELYE